MTCGVLRDLMPGVFDRELLENVILVDLYSLVLGLQRRWFV